jgi:hypothetical protein
VCSFFDGETAKRPQFHNLREAAIDAFQTSERIIQREHGYLVGCCLLNGLVDRHALHTIAALDSVVTTSVVDEDAPHDLCGDTKEMSPTPPIDLPLIDKSQICFVDERRRLQGVPRPLATKLAPGDTAQLGIHERQQLIESAVVPATPIVEQRRDVRGRGHHNLSKAEVATG